MKKILALLLSLLMIMTLAGCAKQEEETATTTETTETAETVAETVTPGTEKRDGVDYVTVEAPATERANNVISAEEWSTVLPNIYESYMANSENSENVQYLDTNDYLKAIYEGYGFAKDYKSARGHSYVLEDVNDTARPHALANCLTCKTADYTALVNATGTDAYSLNFEDVYPNMMENVGCYTCHENNAGNEGQRTLTHDYTVEVADQLLADGLDYDLLTCGQCHTEYYFDGNDNKATSVPYTSVETMTPEAELAFYDETGFADWTQESTGTSLIKVQHPEIETVALSSHYQMTGLSCADCHMETATAADGTTYVSHKIVSPLESETILNNTCAKCHGSADDVIAKVKDIQAKVTAREDEVGEELLALKNKLAEATASGNYTDEELTAIRELHRKAQFFFDWDWVENSEGAHNSEIAYECLDTAEGYINDAMKLFK